MYGYVHGEEDSPTPFINNLATGIGSINVAIHHSLLDAQVAGFTGANNGVATGSPFISNTDLHLNSCTPAVDMGNNAAAGLSDITTDIESNARIVNSTIDAGAYESQTAQLYTTVPTISGVTAASVNDLATAFLLHYTGVTGGPDEYSIVPASSPLPGFTAIDHAALTGSPLSIPIPATAEGSYTFRLTVRNSTTGCTSLEGFFSLEVTPTAPTLYVSSAPFSPFAVNTGAPSAPQSYTVSGINLTAGVVINAPADFEISLTAGSGYANTLTLLPSAGTVPNTTVYVRQKATAGNNATGSITHNSTGAVQKIKGIPISKVIGDRVTVGITATKTSVCSAAPSTTLTATVTEFAWTTTPISYNAAIGVSNNTTWFNQITIGAASTCSNLWIDLYGYQAPIPAATNIRLALYSDNGGVPGILIVASPPKNNIQFGINLVPIPTTTLAAGTYWVAFVVDNFCYFNVRNTVGTYSYWQLMGYSSAFSYTLPMSDPLRRDDNIAYAFGAVLTDPAPGTFDWTPAASLSAGTGKTVTANPTTTTTYTASGFDSFGGSVQGSITIEVVPSTALVPTFSNIMPMCAGGANPLPAISSNGIAGTWSPAFDNTTTTTYTFSPTDGSCASNTTLTVTILPKVLPVFTPVSPICAGNSLAPLPTVSNNGITGTWSPALTNMATTTYTFTPDAGMCALPTTLTITINPATTATTTNASACSSYLWPLNNQTYTTSGTYSFADGCGKLQTLNLSIGPPVTPGAALDFDGVNDYTIIPSNTSLNLSQFTIETWVKWGRSGTAVDFICGRSSETMEIHTGGALSNNIRFIPAPGVFLDGGTNTLTPGTWIHLACVYNPGAGVAKMYINGAEVPLNNNGYNPITTPVPSTAVNFSLGRRYNNSYPFRGQLDEFRIWNRALSPCEIQHRRNCEIPANAEGLIVNLHMNQGIAAGDNTAITSLTDASGNGNHASIIGFAKTCGATTSNFVETGGVVSGVSCSSLPPISLAANAVSSQNITGTTSFLSSSCGLIATVQPNGTSPISGSTTARGWIDPVQNPAYVQRHVEISPDAGASTATGRVTLYFTQQEFDAFNATSAQKLPIDPADAANNKANLVVEQRGGISSDGTGSPSSYPGPVNILDPADADITWNATAQLWEVSFPVTGFGGFFVTTPTVTFPVEFLNIEAQRIASSDTVMLRWQTATETNNQGFEVQVSLDSRLFLGVAFVAGAGTSPLPREYTYKHVHAAAAYYRLKQVDIDGATTYSATVFADGVNPLSETLHIFPNPNHGSFRLAGAASAEEVFTAYAYNAQGAVAWQGTVKAGEISTDLPAGIYLLTLINSIGKRYITKIIIE